MKDNGANIGGGGAGRSPIPFLPMGKMCLFPFSPFFLMGKNGKKSILKEREMNTFPSLSIYCFSPFSPWGKMEKYTFFPWAEMGLDPPPPNIIY